MTPHLAHILRHPIKAIGVEEISSAPLTEGRALALDRVWAVAHQAAKFTGQPVGWQAKMNFLRGVAGPKLMAITAQVAGTAVTLTHPRAGRITVDLARPDDQARLIDWLRPLWPAGRPAASHVVQVPDQALTDVPEPWVSVLSLTSLRALEARVGRALSIHRFRGNLWVEGWAVDAERALTGRRLRIGTAVLEVTEPITRCRATCVNPATGQEDCELLESLEAAFGDKDFGLYARVVTGGTIATGAAVEIM